LGEATGSSPLNLASVRRFEAAGFRAWPATSVQYDGAWSIRLTASHPARRLNSVNPLDPGDSSNLSERMGRIARRFEAYGRPLTFRLSPLSAPKIVDNLRALGWEPKSESIVMQLPLSEGLVRGAIDQIPLKDMNRFVSASIAIGNVDPSLRAGLCEVISRIQPTAGLFVLERDGLAVSTTVCVQDGELAGLFEIATAEGERGKGHGRGTVLSALKWARARGARIAWLQVEAANEAALALYRSIGFGEVYRYHYRQAGEGSAHV
jgi:ribosomal protein S18 acetylase RimI-like enzyme